MHTKKCITTRQKKMSFISFMNVWVKSSLAKRRCVILLALSTRISLSMRANLMARRRRVSEALIMSSKGNSDTKSIKK